MSTTEQPTTNGTSMGASNVTLSPKQQLAIAMTANRPALLMGAPGTAKTATIEALAAEQGAYLEVVIASAQDPTTILGIPMPSEDRKYTEPTIPGWARRINEAAAEGKPTILFLDELTTVPPAIAGPLLGVVQSRRADGWTLPAETRIIAAANPPDLAVGGWAIEPAMANRWVHINWPAPLDEWTAWAAGQSSPSLKLIAEYVSTIGMAALLAVPSDIRKRSGAWASPRSWTNAAAMLDAAPGADVATVAALAVGDSAAGMFAAWIATRDVPTVDELLSGAKPLPERRDAFVTALDNLVRAATDDTLGRTIEILSSAIATDPAEVRRAATDLARTGHISGIAALVAALDAVEAAGIAQAAR